jgi:hypothetical protein
MVFSAVTMMGELALAATYYVSNSTANSWTVGKDSNPCTATNAPCLSILGGLAKMSSGDTLIINDGTYVESLDDAVPSGGGTEATRTIVKCLRPRACTLDASFWAWNFTNSDTSWITIQDMVICCGESVLVRLGTRSSLPTTDFPHHMRFQGNDIHSSSLYCVYTGHGEFIEFINNKIHDCQGQGIYAIFRDSTFRGNEVYRTGMANVPGKNQAMQVSTSGGMTPKGNLIEANTFHHGPGDCLTFGSASSHTVRRNLFYSCGGHGLGAITGTGVIDNSLLDHNVFYGNGQGLVMSDTHSTGNRVRNNIAVGNIGYQIYVCGSCGTMATNLTTGSPTIIWTNPAYGVFTLRTGSPAIDVCTDIGLPFTGYAPDCGALEAGTDTTAPLRPVILSVE